MRGGHTHEVRRILRATCSRCRVTRATSCSWCSTGWWPSSTTAQVLGEVGPGAVLGERALLEGGERTSTLRAVTPVRVAAAQGSAVDLDRLRELSERHRGENQPPQSRLIGPASRAL